MALAYNWMAPIVKAYFYGEAIPTKVRNNADRPGWFVVHVFTGTTALLVGTLQISEQLRNSYRNLHRWLGRSYVALVFVSALTSLALDPRLSIYGTDFLRPLAASMWIGFTFLGVVAIRKRDFEGHRRWMTRSYILAYMGITFLILSGICKVVGMPIEIRYPLVIWGSLLINVTVAEVIIWRSINQTKNVVSTVSA
ncbi:MAG: DUF2306 domain-containing protein [Hyphomicrobiales bacterium]